MRFAADGGRPRRRATLGVATPWLLAVWIVALLAVSPGVASAAAGPVIVDEQQESERLLELTIESSAFAAPTGVHVNLPVGYEDDPDRRWPVAYYLAGTNHTYRSFNDIYDGEALSADFPGIVVSPNGDAGYWSDWFNAGAFGQPMYETFVVDELVPLIDARFRTTGDRDGRAVLGESMGGYGVMMFAARHPDVFAAASSISGAVDSNLPANGAVLSASPTLQGAEPDAIYGPRATEEIRWRGHNPVDLAENLRHVDVQISSANGTPDPDLEGTGDAPGCPVEAGVHMASVSLHDTLSALDIDHVWTDWGAGCHSVPNFRRQIIASFARFATVLGGGPAATPARFDHLAVEPVVDVWGWRVEADPDRALEFLRLQDVGATGLTLVGSGTTTVTTPPLFPGVAQVAVTGAEESLATPDADGRITFTVALGPANTTQALTAGSSNPAVTAVVTLAPVVPTGDGAADAADPTDVGLAATGGSAMLTAVGLLLIAAASVVGRRGRRIGA